MTSKNRSTDNIFITEDPQGRKVSLRRGVWEKHISTKHPDKENTKENIKRTVEAPNVIVDQEGLYTNTYAYSNNSITNPEKYVNVLVRFTDKEKKVGNVRTSYVSKKRPAGKVIWVNKKY